MEFLTRAESFDEIKLLIENMRERKFVDVTALEFESSKNFYYTTQKIDQLYWEEAIFEPKLEAVKVEEEYLRLKFLSNIRGDQKIASRSDLIKYLKSAKFSVDVETAILEDYIGNNKLTPDYKTGNSVPSLKSISLGNLSVFRREMMPSEKCLLKYLHIDEKKLVSFLSKQYFPDISDASAEEKLNSFLDTEIEILNILRGTCYDLYLSLQQSLKEETEFQYIFILFLDGLLQELGKVAPDVQERQAHLATSLELQVTIPVVGRGIGSADSLQTFKGCSDVIISKFSKEDLHASFHNSAVFIELKPPFAGLFHSKSGHFRDQLYGQLMAAGSMSEEFLNASRRYTKGLLTDLFVVCFMVRTHIVNSDATDDGCIIDDDVNILNTNDEDDDVVAAVDNNDDGDGGANGGGNGDGGANDAQGYPCAPYPSYYVTGRATNPRDYLLLILLSLIDDPDELLNDIISRDKELVDVPIDDEAHESYCRHGDKTGKVFEKDTAGSKRKLDYLQAGPNNYKDGDEDGVEDVDDSCMSDKVIGRLMFEKYDSIRRNKPYLSIESIRRHVGVMSQADKVNTWISECSQDSLPERYVNRAKVIN